MPFTTRVRFAAASLALAAVSKSQPAAALSPERLVIGTTQEFETLNPLIMSTSAATYIANMVSRSVMTMDAKWQWVCNLCEQIPSLTNGGAKIITVGGKKKVQAVWRLKPGYKWADGTAVTAKDFALTMEIGRSPHVQVPERQLYTQFEPVELDPKDPLKFTLTTTEPNAEFYRIASIKLIASHIEGPIWAKTKNTPEAYEKQSAYVTAPTTPGLYFGPYIVQEVKLGSHVSVTPNPHWPGTKPQFAKIIVRSVGNNQALESAALTGEVDLINEVSLMVDQVRGFEKRMAADAALRQRFKVLERDGILYAHMDLNLDNPFLASKEVRKALVYGFDREKLIKALFSGKQTAADQYYHPTDVNYTSDVVKYPYDPAKANALLDAAGWKMGPKGIREKDGKRFDLNIMAASGSKALEMVEQFIQAEYKKIGIAVTIKNEPGRVYFGETLARRAFTGGAIYSWVSSPDTSPRSTLSSKEIPSKANGWAGQNYPGWRHPRVDELLALVDQEFDAAKRKAYLNELMRIYTDEVPVIPLYMRPMYAIVPASMEGLALTGHQYESSERVEEWRLGGTSTAR